MRLRCLEFRMLSSHSEHVTNDNLPRKASFSTAMTNPYHICLQALMPIGPIT